MARKNSTGLTPAVIESLRKQSKSFSDIARMFGVSRQYVNWIVTNYGGVSRTPREVLRGKFPYKADGRFHGCIIGRLLRHHLEYVATDGRGMGYEKLQRLRTFYLRLQNDSLVVDFDPELPPYPGNKFGGYSYTPRLDSDDGLIIRINPYTKPMTPEEKDLWRVPSRIPSPSMPIE